PSVLPEPEPGALDPEAALEGALDPPEGLVGIGDSLGDERSEPVEQERAIPWPRRTRFAGRPRDVAHPRQAVHALGQDALGGPAARTREPLRRRLDERNVAHDAGDLGVVRGHRIEEWTQRRLRRRIAEDEVERVGPNGRRDRLVPVPNDPEADDLEGVGARRQVPGDPERELVAGL